MGFANALESYRAELPLLQWDVCPWVAQVFSEKLALRDFCREMHKLHQGLGLAFPSSPHSHSEPYPL